MFSPFKNGLLRRYDGFTKQKLNLEKDDRRTTPKEEVALQSSPIIQERHTSKGQIDNADTAAQNYDRVETSDSTYSPPSILDEDEDDPQSHAAMTRRAEEILANAKKRLTVSPRED